ncbi:hypothetical protein LUCX_317 [Xanthomonas phage vB_XciM_LucasX]|nr:hypothetical protein LUCX_317 [Xanthomonas phage vB_XciM_LucasX]
MALNTPPLHAKGLYTLRTPWVIASDTQYECIAIRSFRDFAERGEDVYTKYYAPKEVSREQYEADMAAGANIITLESETASVVHVPDSFIEKFPDITGVAYKRIVISVLLGPLPDAVDLTYAKAQLAAVASDITGVENTVNEHVAPYSGVVTAEQHATLEVARQAAITNRTTDRATVLSQQVIIDAQAERIANLEQALMALQQQDP